MGNYYRFQSCHVDSSHIPCGTFLYRTAPQDIAAHHSCTYHESPFTRTGNCSVPQSFVENDNLFDQNGKFAAFPHSFPLDCFFLWRAEINPSSTIKALAKYYFVGLNDRWQCVHNDPVLVISSDLGRKSEPAICSPVRSQKSVFSSMEQPTLAMMTLLGPEAFLLSSEHVRVLITTHVSSDNFQKRAGGELTTCHLPV